MNINNSNKSNINNGLITKIWGPPAWEYLHAVTFGYPIHPTQGHKDQYLEFFKNVGNTLPCGHCRDSYKEFILSGITILDMDAMKSRDTLTKWLYLIHQQVNNKLGISYGVTFENIREKYESFRASCSKSKKVNAKGCVMPLDDKAESYKKAYNKNCPLIPYDVAIYFEYYAKLRGLHNAEFKYFNNLKDKKKYCKMINDKCCDLWCQRDKECGDIIKNMRLHAIDSLEVDGPYKNLPTTEELKLILRFSSNLSIEKLSSLIEKLPFDENYSKNKKKHKNRRRITIYKLVRA